MSGIEDQGLRPRNVEAAPVHYEDDDEERVESVPAGGAGADSGASEAVRIDPEDESAVPNRSPHNDIAGVGTRDPEGDRPAGDG